mgnify:CR=1 FL=1
MVAKVKQDKAVIGEQTREEILEAASYYFVENGFEGTSIQNVADRAKVNKSLIYHHFQSKEELWKTVKTYIIKKSTFMDYPCQLKVNHLWAWLKHTYYQLKIQLDRSKKDPITFALDI